jgi:hypothetical protein
LLEMFWPHLFVMSTFDAFNQSNWYSLQCSKVSLHRSWLSLHCFCVSHLGCPIFASFNYSLWSESKRIWILFGEYSLWFVNIHIKIFASTRLNLLQNIRFKIFSSKQNEPKNEIFASICLN